ncbi:ankyrin repeat-containing domain protein [Mycena olivaceomarginata]|nr:ankyrin repeat-containing domain protein [Mycena olivaceomarginata]
MKTLQAQTNKRDELTFTHLTRICTHHASQATLAILQAHIGGLASHMLCSAILNPTRTKEGALHYASLNGHIEVVEFLLERGANFNATDKANNTALHNASARGRTDVVKLLVEHGVDVNVIGMSL